ncbi:hypothetical protein PMIN06_001843 [Paraphaeosphaeria minitans]
MEEVHACDPSPIGHDAECGRGGLGTVALALRSCAPVHIDVENQRWLRRISSLRHFALCNAHKYLQPPARPSEAHHKLIPSISSSKLPPTPPRRLRSLQAGRPTQHA